MGSQQLRPTEDCAEWCSELVAKSGQKFIFQDARALSFRARRPLAFEQCFAFFVMLNLLRNIASNLGSTDNFAAQIFNWRDRQGQVNPRAVSAHSLRLIVVNALTAADFIDDSRFFPDKLWRKQHQDRFTDCLVGSVAKHVLCGG